MGEEGSQQTGWGAPSEWREPGSSSCCTSYCCLMVRICSSISDLLGEKHHFSAMGVRGELWGKPGGKARSWVRSLPQKQLYWEMFGFWGQKGKWKVRVYQNYKCPLEHSFPLLQRWAGCTTQINAYILILISFISNLVLHVLGLLMPHCSTNHAAIALVKQCVGVGFFLGTGTSALTHRW